MREDCLRRFFFEDHGVRGEWINLSQSWQQAKSHQIGSPAAIEVLGQGLAAAALLSATLKFKGNIIIQAQGTGQFKTLVAQSTHDCKIRGLIRTAGEIEPGPFEALFGHGRIVITIQPDNADPYQGIVPLKGVLLADALQTYFSQSEQLNTRLWLAADDQRAAGLLLQELPQESRETETFAGLSLIADTIKAHELLSLDCETLLFRLYHQEKVRLFPPKPVLFECACSKEKIELALHSLGHDELSELVQSQEVIEVGCEFCNRQFYFDPSDLEKLLALSRNLH